MSIITPADFKAQNAIAQRELPHVAALIQEFIDKYEPMFLKKLLGLTLYDQFVTGLIPIPVEPPTDPVTYEPIPEIWLALRDDMDLKPMIVNYVYFWYMENANTSTTGSSEVKAKNENSVPVSNWDKRVRAWNEMAALVRLFDLSTVDYPDYVRPYWARYSCWFKNCGIDEIFYYKNTLNF